jgi:hypothetical protein
MEHHAKLILVGGNESGGTSLLGRGEGGGSGDGRGDVGIGRGRG